MVEEDDAPGLQEELLPMYQSMGRRGIAKRCSWSNEIYRLRQKTSATMLASGYNVLILMSTMVNSNRKAFPYNTHF